MKKKSEKLTFLQYVLGLHLPYLSDGREPSGHDGAKGQEARGKL